MIGKVTIPFDCPDCGENAPVVGHQRGGHGNYRNCPNCGRFSTVYRDGAEVVKTPEAGNLDVYDLRTNLLQEMAFVAKLTNGKTAVDPDVMAICELILEAR